MVKFMFYNDSTETLKNPKKGCVSMKIKAVIVVLISILLTNISFADVSDGKFRIWTTFKASSDINKDFRLDVEEEFRWGDNASEHYYSHTDVGITYKNIADWLDVGINYRYAEARKGSSSPWKVEHRPHLNATIKGMWNDIKLSNRSRLEFRNIEDKDAVLRYRNKFKAVLPVELTSLKLKPYVADEILISFNSDKFDTNRLYAGVSTDVTKNLSADFYYIYQASKSNNDWINFNILGFSLKYKF
jgi:hypothetical protein